MKTLTEQTNALLKRREVVVEKAYASNPGKAEVTKDIAAVFKTSEDAVSVKHIDSTFGTSVFKIEAFIYNDATAKGLLEPKQKKKEKA